MAYNVEELLEEILSNQESARESFEEFREEVLEKLDNVGVPTNGFQVKDS